MRHVLALLAAAGFATVMAEPADPGVAASDAGGPHRFSAEEIKAAVESHVRSKASADDGVYRLVDDRTGDEVGLEFIDVAMVGPDTLWQIHNPARKDAAGDFFACVNFRAAGGPPGRVYDIDMLLVARDGKLVVRQALIHKAPQLVEGRWVKVARPPESH
jgi:hypothetical protein